MFTLTVVRHVPPPIVGMCGVGMDRTAGAFEADLDWIEGLGTEIERREPADEADDSLPIVMVDGSVVSTGHYPTRSELAHLVGRHHHQRDDTV